MDLDRFSVDVPFFQKLDKIHIGELLTLFLELDQMLSDLFILEGAFKVIHLFQIVVNTVIIHGMVLLLVQNSERRS
jgi:hypothetical protein